MVAAEMEPHRVYAEEGCSEQDQAHEGGYIDNSLQDLG